MDIARNCVFDSNAKTVDGLYGVRCLEVLKFLLMYEHFCLENG